MAKRFYGSQLALGGIETQEKGITFLANTHNWSPDLPDLFEPSLKIPLLAQEMSLSLKIGSHEDAIGEMNETLRLADLQPIEDNRFPYTTCVSIYRERIEVTSYFSEEQFETILQQAQIFVTAVEPKFFWTSVSTRVVCGRSNLAVNQDMAHAFFEEGLVGLLSKRPHINFVFGSEEPN